MTKNTHMAPRASNRIDLGAASVETRGGVKDPIYDNPQSALKNQPGLAAD